MKTKDIQFIVIYDNEEQQILSFQKIEHFGLKICQIINLVFN